MYSARKTFNLPITNISFQRNKLHLLLTQRPDENLIKTLFFAAMLLRCCIQIFIASDQVVIKSPYFRNE